VRYKHSGHLSQQFEQLAPAALETLVPLLGNAQDSGFATNQYRRAVMPLSGITARR